MNDVEEVGFIKYDGGLVEGGVIDAAAASRALAGLDDAIRYFNSRQSSKLASLPYELPVRIRSGSWEAWVLGGAGIFAAAYLGTAAKEMAKADWEGVGLRDVFAKSVDAARHLVRLVKHTGKSSGWDFTNLVWRENNEEVGIPNTDGELIFVPSEYVKWFGSVPSKLLEKLVIVVEEDRDLVVGSRSPRSGEIRTERIALEHKPLFVSPLEADVEGEEILFPELKHGERVVLEGRLTRGNASTNSVGFEYRNHILNCVPDEGSIVQFKPALFLPCTIEGTITRLHGARKVMEKRPTVIINRIISIEESGQQALI